MNKRTYSPTYVHLLDLIFKIKTSEVTTSTQKLEGNKLNIISIGKSDRVIQEITIANDELWSMCSPTEWYLLGKIGRELKYGNALWQIEPEFKAKSSNRRTIATLVAKNLMIPTETTNIYIINPFYLRKGDLIRVLHGTAEQLINVTKVLPDHIKSIQRTNATDFTHDQLRLLL